MQLGGFLSIYLLLLVIAGIFTYCKIPQTKFLLLGTLQMTVQLIIAGYVLLYIFKPVTVLRLNLSDTHGRLCGLSYDS